MRVVQTLPGPILVAAKRLLPQSIKNMIKPGLRALGVLPADTTPEFQRRKRSTAKAPPKP